MFPKEFTHWIKERVVNGEREFALFCKFVGEDVAWILKSYNRMPSDDVVTEDVELILRSIEFYHIHIRLPDCSIKTLKNQFN